MCRRPAVSTMTTSRPRACAASIASKATAAGSEPRTDPTKSAPARFAQISSCSSAAARNVSAAARITDLPWSRSVLASLPIVVVLPVPLTPTTSTTLGGWARASGPGSPSSAAISSSSAVPRSRTSPRCSRRRTSSAVAGTPTSAVIKASSSRSHASSSAGSNAAAASCCVRARRLFERDSRSRPKKRSCSASASCAGCSSPRASAQVRVTRWRRACRRARAGRRRARPAARGAERTPAGRRLAPAARALAGRSRSGRS